MSLAKKKKKNELVLPPIQSDLEPSLTGRHVHTVRPGNSHSLVVTSNSQTWEHSFTGRHVHSQTREESFTGRNVQTVRPGTVILWSSRPYSQTLNSHSLVVTYEQRQLVVFFAVRDSGNCYAFLFCLILFYFTDSNPSVFNGWTNTH